MDNFYGTIGPQIKLLDGKIARPLQANLFRGLIALLLLLVPLLYVAIFMARKKHAMAIGEWDKTSIGLLRISGISERERIRRTKTNTIGTQIHFGAWFIDVSFYRCSKTFQDIEVETCSVLYTQFSSCVTFTLDRVYR